MNIDEIVKQLRERPHRRAAETHDEMRMRRQKEREDAAAALEAQAKRITELEKENEQLKLFRPYRTELTDCLKTMSIGDKACFPAGDEYEKRRKSILRLAQLTGIKVRTRHVMKDNLDQISVERIG